MSDSWFYDANFNGISDETFDDFFKNCDFPLENVETNNIGIEEDWETQFQSLDPPPFGLSNFLSDIYNDPFSSSENNSSLRNKAPEVKQQASSDAGSTEGVFPCKNLNDTKDVRLFQSSSPVSVLESSSSCSAENTAPVENKLTFLGKGTRSKRRRATNFKFHRIFPFFSSSVECHPSDSELETHVTGKTGGKKQKRKKNLTKLSCPEEIKKPNTQPSSVPRKCTHCEVTETPQWREGPSGPKTLCNACGVRYRSGRLLPEYRPAASPTFVPSLHSNCHKKVIEMRSKGIQVNSRNYS